MAAKPNSSFKILLGNAAFELQSVKAESIDTVFTSPEPPYNYLQLQELEEIMLQLPRVLKPTGSIWVNMGDVHNDDGVQALIPERFVYDMVIEHGWKLRNTVIWNRNAASFDIGDSRRFRRDHEYLYWFVKDVKKHYWPELAWTVPDVTTTRYEFPREGVFESGFPESLIEQTAIMTTPPHGRILDPFCGTGTTGVVALKHNREFLGIDANPLLIPKVNERLTSIQNPIINNG
jgi:DNA modification methylase